VALYFIYLFYVRDHPEGSANFQNVPALLIGFMASTAMFVAIYLIWFLVSMIVTFYHFCRVPLRNRLMTLANIAFLFICVGTVFAGVYSPYYWNGGIFMFFQALFNLYIFVILFLNWPTDTSEDISYHEQIEMQQRF